VITDFLKADLPREDLAAALRVLAAFKACENEEEWLKIPFVAWAKFEQLEEFLEHLVRGKPLREDTLRYIRERSAS